MIGARRLDMPFGLLPKKTAMDAFNAPEPEPVTSPITLEYIDTRGEGGKREKLVPVLNKVPNSEPELDDWLED